MNAEYKLNKIATEKGFKDCNSYLDWMIHQMNYNSEQITQRILSAIDGKNIYHIIKI